MARKAKPKTRRSRKPKSINLLNLTESYLIGNAVTQGMFGTTLYNFATEGWLRSPTSGRTGGSNYGFTLSAAELVQAAMGADNTSTNGVKGVGAAVRYHLSRRGAKMVGTLIFLPIAFKAGRRLARKPINMVNKLLPGGTVKL